MARAAHIASNVAVDLSSVGNNSRMRNQSAAGRDTLKRSALEKSRIRNTLYNKIGDLIAPVKLTRVGRRTDVIKSGVMKSNSVIPSIE